VVKYEIRGDWSQTVVCRLDAHQELLGELGRFLWKSPNIQMEVGPRSRWIKDPSQGRGLLGRALSTAAGSGKRPAARDSLPLQHFTVIQDTGLCAFTGIVPGEIRTIESDGTSEWTVRRGSLVAAEGTLRIAGRNSRPTGPAGNGFDGDRFTGPGTLFIGANGHFIDLNPESQGGVVQVDPGRVVAWDDQVAYSIESVAGMRGEHIPVATIKGDGKVILQTGSGVVGRESPGAPKAEMAT